MGRPLLDVLRDRWWLVIVGALLGAAAAATVIGTAIGPGASASSSVIVSDEAIEAAGGTGYQIEELRQLIGALATEPSTARTVEDAVGADAPIVITATSETRSPVVELSVAAADPDVAKAAADALATVLAAERAALYREVSEPLAEGLRADLERAEARLAEIELEYRRVPRIDDLRRGSLDEARRRTATQLDAGREAMANLERSAEAAMLSVRPVGPARSTGRTPSGWTVTLLAVIAGAVSGLGSAILLDERSARTSTRRRSRFRSEPMVWELDRMDEPPALVIGWGDVAALEPDDPAIPPGPEELSAYRAILNHSVPPTGRVIAVAGAADHDGSGFAALSLAHAAASSGNDVALLSFGLPPMASSAEEVERGLGAVVHGDLTVDEAIIPVWSASGTVRYLPPGAVDSPADLRPHLQTIANLLTTLLDGGTDRIILELPPVLGSRDTPALASLADGLVLSTVTRETRTRDLAQATEDLRRVRCPILAEVNHVTSLPRPILARAGSDDDSDEMSGHEAGQEAIDADDWLGQSAS